MSLLKVEISQNRDVVLNSRTANLLLDSGNGNAALLYIYIISHSGEIELSSASERLKMAPDEILKALDALRQLNLVGNTDAAKTLERADETPEYTTTDIAEHIGSDKSFKFLVNFCEEKLGKFLSTVDLRVLLSIYSWLGLPVDVICLLVTSCIDETRKKYGPGRVPTMRTIEKRAKLWLRDGVLTSTLAEEYLAKQEELNSAKKKIARILQISGRALSPSEDRYISEWLSLPISEELIANAYDKTLINTGSLNWRYMSSILESWHSLGIKTTADIQRLDKKPRDDKPAKVATPSISDEAAAMRLRELNRKNKMNTKE